VPVPGHRQWVGDAQARQRAAAEIDSQLAGPRASALLLGALPLLGLAMGAGMGADPLRTLFGGPVGLAALGSGVLLEIAGVLWVRRIVAAAVAA
jgi:tight adherence protein B